VLTLLRSKLRSPILIPVSGNHHHPAAGETTETTMTTELITGNTYPVKDQIKALGGRWDAAAKGWRVPAESADQARSLVSGAPKSAPRASNGGAAYSKEAWLRAHPKTGCSCGSREGYMGKYDCATCREDF
jgi:hypothetical protein